jgi:hypothetical protein
MSAPASGPRSLWTASRRPRRGTSSSIAVAPLGGCRKSPLRRPVHRCPRGHHHPDQVRSAVWWDGARNDQSSDAFVRPSRASATRAGFPESLVGNATANPMANPWEDRRPQRGLVMAAYESFGRLPSPWRQEAVDAAVELRVDEHRLDHALGHASALPALGMQRRPWRPAPAAVMCESTSHVVSAPRWRRCDARGA